MGRRRSTPQDVLAKIDWIGQHPCSVWTGHVGTAGYGRVTYHNEDWLVHRLIYTWFVGPIPEGYDVDHVCHNEDPHCDGVGGCMHRLCCEPSHLEAKPPRDNILAGKGWAGRQSRQTECKRGHDLTDPANLIVDRRGCRSCRECQKIHKRAWRAAQKVA